ncbi:MAG: murein biosynthesis integral membrane protein MurJ [Notoacmeibacter sp.]|nr:murein biosynthesis integral membrane protein MurJ [Notoacmeibacter sp.]
MSLVGKFASVGSATMASRIMGFVREALIGAALGAGPVADAFYAAFGFPNLFRRLFAEGAFNSAFIPLFAKEVEGGGLEAARKFAEQVLAVLVAVLIAVTGLAILFMPALVATVVAPLFRDTPDKFALTVDLTRIMFPYLLCMSLVAMFSGILNSLRRYFLAAIVPVLLNVILVGATVAALRLGIDSHTTGYWLAWGVFASGFIQLALLVWGVWREGLVIPWRLPRMTPQVRRLLVLMGPAMLTGGVVQINIMIGRIIASAQDGAIALLNYADRINQLPLGVIGIAIGVVLLPELSRALKAHDIADANHLQNRSLEFALGLTLPAAVGFMIMPAPLVNILYERGAFNAETTRLTAQALAAFAAGLPAYVLIKVFQPAYFAREDMKTPLWFSAFTVFVNVALSLLLFPLYGHVAIAAATAVSAWVNLVLLSATLWRRRYFQPSGRTLRRVVMIVASSAAMGAFLLVAQILLAAWFASPSLATRLAATLAVVVAAAILYLAFVLATGGLDRAELARAIRRRRPA